MAIMVELMQTLWLFSVAWATAVFRFFKPPPPKSIKGEIALITGGANGIGRLFAVSLAQRGAKVVIWDVDKEGMETTKEMVENHGGSIATYAVDLSKREEITEATKRVKNEVGMVTILINNAGIVGGRSLLEMPDEQIRKTMNVNLFSHFWTVKSFLPAMLEKDHGHILNIASSVGLFTLRNLSDYSASKFGVVGFTECLDYEITFTGCKNVHTTLVCPHHIKTQLFRGCKQKYNWLTPSLTPEYVVDRSMQALLTNQKILYMPRILYFLTVVKAIFPADVLREFLQVTGAQDFMSGFEHQEDRKEQTRQKEHVK